MLAAATLAVGLLASTVHAADDAKLLPPDQAFRLSARSVDAKTLEARFNVADGYYLYRDKIAFRLEPASAALGPIAMPAGKLKKDEFFGEMQTYRGLVVVRLPIVRVPPGKVVLVAESQGCADAGVCYPPQSQRVEIPPAGHGSPGPTVEAIAPQPAWFK